MDLTYAAQKTEFLAILVLFYSVGDNTSRKIYKSQNENRITKILFLF